MEQVNSSEAVIAKLEEENKALQNKVKELEFKAEQLELQLQKALIQLYGSKSDKAKEPDEPSTFDEPELISDVSPEELDQADEELTIPEHKRKKPKRKPLPKNLPRTEIIHDLPESDKICKCGNTLTHICDEDSEQLEYVPAKVTVIVNKRRKYACKSCEETIKLAPLPKIPIPKSIATASLLATVLVAKYVDHLPLYRQEQIWQRCGVDIPRQTMCNWVIKCAKLLAGIVAVMKANILASNYARADETTVQVLKEEGRNATDKSYMWIFMTGLKTNNNIVFEYHATRASVAATEFFAGFKGYLQTDAYGGYNALRKDSGIINVGCMAHCRRNFTDITKVVKKAGKAHEALKYIRALYKIEEHIKDDDFDKRYQYRLEHAVPILEKFKIWLNQSIIHVPPKNPLAQAINYAINHWPELTRYLEHRMLEIDNNWCENQIRPFACGRRNWLFAGNVTGAWASSIIYSLVVTAKANGLNPWQYLVDVLTKAPYCETADDFAKLVPVPGYFGSG